MKDGVRVFRFLKPKVVHEVPPYASLAAIYDRVMRHVDYRGWASFVRDVAAAEGVQAGKVLDLACGTGSFLREFLARPFQGAGCDSSQPMVLVARKKFLKRKNAPLLWVAHMCQTGARGPFDLIVCLYDSINYLPGLDEYGMFFEEVARLLRPGGLFIFDVCTIQNSLIHFNGCRDSGRIGKWEFLRYSHFDRTDAVQTNEFLIGVKGQLEERAFLEVHRQRIRPLDEVEAILRESPLQLIAVYDGFSHGRGTEASLRVHYVCKKGR